MARYAGRRLALVGLLAALGGAVGCEDRRDVTVREEAREAGQETRERAREAGREARELQREAGEKAREARDSAREAVEGFREGWGGAGEQPTPPPAPEVEDERDETR